MEPQRSKFMKVSPNPKTKPQNNRWETAAMPGEGWLPIMKTRRCLWANWALNSLQWGGSLQSSRGPKSCLKAKPSNAEVMLNVCVSQCARSNSHIHTTYTSPHIYSTHTLYITHMSLLVCKKQFTHTYHTHITTYTQDTHTNNIHYTSYTHMINNYIS